MRTAGSKRRMALRELFWQLFCGTLAGLFAIWIAYNDWRALPLVIPIAYFVIRALRDERARKEHQLLEQRFRTFLDLLQAALGAGNSMEHAVMQVTADLEKSYGKDDVLVRPLLRICHGITLREPVEKLFSAFGEESGQEDIRCFGEILMVAKRTGGDLARTMAVCRRTLCERIDLRLEIASLVASKQFEQRIMSLVPALIILYLRLSFGSLMERLYKNPAGIVIMSAALLLYGFSLWLGKRMVRIEV